MRKFTKRSTAVITAVVAVSGAGAAWAAWALTGEGSATATAGTAAKLEITGTSFAPLVPGGKSDVTLTVSNPNPFPVTVTSVDFINITTTKEGCPASTDVAIVSEALPSTPTDALNIEAKTTTEITPSKSITIKEALRMSGDAADACQGAQFTIKTALNAKSNAS